MGTICHIRPVDRDQNVSSGDAELTWHPSEGLAEMAGVTEFAVRNYELGSAPRGRSTWRRSPGRSASCALTDYRVETAHDALEVLFRLEEGLGARAEADTAGARVVRPRRARCPEARRGGQGVDAEVREAGFGGDLRRGVR